MDDQKNLYIIGPLANNSTIKMVLFWISLLILMGMGSLAILFFKDGLTIELMVMGISALPILFALELNRRNNIQLAGTIIAVALTLMITILATIGQGIYDIAVMAYPAILIVASLILRRNTTIYLTVFLIACIGWLIFGEMYGFYQPQFPDQSYARQFYVASIILIITALAVQFLNNTVRSNVIAIQHELEERKLAELKLKQREAILSAVAHIAQQLLKASNWRDEINAILEKLGKATGASHVYIFENHLRPGDGILLSSMKYEWTATGIKPELDNPNFQDSYLRPSVPGLEDWYANLNTGKPFYGSAQQYTRFWKKVFEPQGLKTLLDVPIYVNDQWWGIIGFDDFVNEMPWSQAEIDALMAAAGNLGTVISRQQSDIALRASEEKFQLAFHHTFVPMIISRAHDRIILDANHAFCKGTGYTRAEVLGRTGTQLNLWANTEAQLRHHQLLEEHGHAEEFKAEFRRKSGEVGVALISAISIHLGDELCLLHTLYDISKIEELLNELKAKNEELQSFTYTVSHDLRAPLITISGFLGYLEQDAVKGDVERVKRDALRINDAVSKMQRLLSELLELSRIGRLMNSPEAVSFGEIIEEALRLVEGRLKAQQAEVRVEADFPMIHGDRMRLVGVVQNLVDNAAKFMGDQKHPKINIGVNVENAKPIFFVRDNGAGIEPGQHEQVFGLFNKLDANTEGTGIGLALVKRIVEVHGGKIWIESDGKGNGTTFYFTLSDSSNGKGYHEKETPL